MKGFSADFFTIKKTRLNYLELKAHENLMKIRKSKYSARHFQTFQHLNEKIYCTCTIATVTTNCLAETIRFADSLHSFGFVYDIRI